MTVWTAVQHCRVQTGTKWREVMMLKWNKNCAKLTCSVTCSQISRDREVWALSAGMNVAWKMATAITRTKAQTNKYTLEGINHLSIRVTFMERWMSSIQMIPCSWTEQELFVLMPHPHCVGGVCIWFHVDMCVSLVVLFLFSLSFSFCAGVTVHACATMHALVQVSCPVCLNTSSFSSPGNVQELELQAMILALSRNICTLWNISLRQ